MWKWILCLVVVVVGLGAGQLSSALFEREEAEVARIRELVANGTLPKSALDQAERRLADAKDQLTLSETLYSGTRLQDMTQRQADEMMAAAARRVDRAAENAEERRKLLDMGIISRVEFAKSTDEVYQRQLVLDLAKNRVKLMDDLRQMALDEERLHSATLTESLIRYDGAAIFTLAALPAMEKSFKAQFHHDLPISALGQTMVHQSLGLDHRNKVDVALNPEQPEGLWLRRYLEKLHLPYLAFRNAVAGAATGAHIHIGTGSSRVH